MKSSEFLREFEDVAADSNASLVTVLNFLKSRADNKGLVAKIKTQSLINLVKNTGVPFDYNALVAANESNEAVKNLIKSFNKIDCTLQSDTPDDEVTNAEPSGAPHSNTSNPADTVDSMAHSAMNNRQ